MALIPFPTSETVASADTWTAPLWEAAARGEVTVPKCAQCGRFRMQPTPFCPNCQSQEVTWPVLSGRGRLYSYTCLKHPRAEGQFYCAAVIELDDAPGVRILSNVVEAEESELAVDMPLEVAFFQPLAGGYAIPMFRPARRS